MRISISNLAWDVRDDELVASLLNTHGIDAIDIAPGKYFQDFKNTGVSDIDRVRQWWSGRGISIVGMQALLYGTDGLNLFGTDASKAAMIDHLREVFRIASGLGATKLVFGSPRNRDRSSLSDGQALEIAVDFFRRLGDEALEYGVLLCLEPNPPCYGCNFMTTSHETATIVNGVSHPAIRMQLDTGAITINAEDCLQVIKDYGPLIGHVHASEPDLVVLGDGKTDHAKAAAALANYLPDQVVAIEMLQPKTEPVLSGIERALGVAIDHYRNGSARLSKE